MFDLDQEIINKETNVKYTVQYRSINGSNYCIEEVSSGKRYHTDGYYAEKHFRAVKVGD